MVECAKRNHNKDCSQVNQNYFFSNNAGMLKQLLRLPRLTKEDGEEAVFNAGTGDIPFLNGSFSCLFTTKPQLFSVDETSRCAHGGDR